MYRKVSTDLSFPQREKEILEFWKKENIFEKSMSERAGETPYIFYDGPPTANGAPHIGHVLTRVIKDTIPRYRTMKGYQVPRKAGWDTHGLPVELEVEKLLGLDGKEQIEEYGLAEFIGKCKESVWKYKGMWEDFSGIVGFWADMDDPYVTYHNEYIESEWWALKQIFDKGLLYKGFKIVPYCPRCGTPLSSHEVAQGYKEVKEKSAYVKFRVKGEDAYILAWTTTPWTLPSNVALCVNPQEKYVKVSCGGEVYYLADGLADAVLKDMEYRVLESMTGKDLEYKEYEPLFRFVSPGEKCWYVTCADFVTLSDGTGVVHIAPAFGEDDASVGRTYGLPFVQLVDSKGEMKAETDWPGVFCKDADKEILRDLKERGLLLSSPSFTHSYPFCWRCDTPLLYYARESWFIRMTAVKDRLIANNNTVNWVPESMGKGRFGDWLENVQDWAISRDRYWGTPLNVWVCSCGHLHSVGSIEELCGLSPNCPGDIELHRPYIDEVTFPCPQCGGEMSRTPEVVDCWFDSGAMPFAQHHYPFENKELFEAQFPADFISEAVDQTRGWFYSLLAISTLIFDKAPFKNVIVLGHVQDKDGQKMSKSKGNAVDPMEALLTYGADTIRWYFLSNSAPWLPNRFHDKVVTDGQRKFLGTLWNTYAFYVLYAGICCFDPARHEWKPETLTVMDRWLLSRLNRTVEEVDANLENYRLPEAARALQDFVDELSNWYVRRGRERFWTEEPDQDSVNAFMTLYTALVTTAKLAAPMIPFMAEEIYRNLVCSLDKDAIESVHLCRFPTADKAMMDEKLEEDMAAVLRIVGVGRAARNGAAIKNRQPLSKMYVGMARAAANGAAGQLPDELGRIILDELNIKELEFSGDLAAFIDYSFKPQLKTVGPKFGKQVGEIGKQLAAIDGAAAKKELDETGALVLELPSGTVSLTGDDLLIETKQREGYYAATDGGLTVAIDTTLTPELEEEGFVREVISKVQIMRKEADFQVTDHISVRFEAGELTQERMERNKDFISRELLADELVPGAPGGFVKECDVNGTQVVFGIALM